MKDDIERLRERVIENLHAAAFGGIPAMILEVTDAEHASDAELIEMAQRLGVVNIR